jgi:alpha-L-rhamnosidase
VILVTDGGWKTAAGQVKVVGPYGMAPWGEVGFTEERWLPGRMLRKEFDTAKPVSRATAYVSGMGLFEMYLNGAKIGADVLSPGLTEYPKRALYVAYDVTAALRKGRNAVGVMLGNGRYYGPRATVPTFAKTFGYPKLLFQMQIEYRDGSTSRVVSDGSWRLTTEGPVRGNNEYDGEVYDARREPEGWARPGFDESRWSAAAVVAPAAAVLSAQMAEPMRVTGTLKAVKVTQPRPGVFIYDMGQNMVGWCRLRVAGMKGTTVKLRHAETLARDGTLYTANLRSARAEDEYTLKGGGVETWEPRFTYHGFRYVEVTGYPGTPKLDAIEGRVVHDAMEPAGSFESSNALLNRIHKNTYWGVRGNYRSIPTDCPQRDERQGWMGDRSQVSRGETYLFDVAAFYSKWMTDIADAQREDGAISDVNPSYWPLYNNDVTWPSTFVLVPGVLYEEYGDTRVIERNYDAMKKWMGLMQGFMKDDLLSKDTYGDWCVPPESPELIHSKDPARQTDRTLLSTAYFHLLSRKMSEYAKLIGRPEDERGFAGLAERLRAAFEKKFFNSQRGLYDNGTQTSSLLPLAFGMTAEGERNRVIDALVKRIHDESHDHIGTGLVGAQWLMRVLSDSGHADLAYTIATQKSYPGWGYMLEKGATTVWELWNGDTADPAMNSGNHVMQIGDLTIWMYEYLGGIRPDPAKPGFKHIIVRPTVPAGLDSVSVVRRTLYGEVRSSWRRTGSSVTLRITVPPNTGAAVYVPGEANAREVEPGAYEFTGHI